ncbi:MAG TPA: hypothetical protein VGO22_13690 [Pseudorhizobium sp.]|jgi:hypothetical protein|nr:hypothetical protein [Pseudorhizobium sp.]
MALTLGLLASVLVLLPGLAVLAAFNFRTRRGGARRPELALTTISALVMAAAVSIVVHLVAWAAIEGALAFVTALHDAYPVLDLGPKIENPLTSFFAAVAGNKPMAFSGAVALGMVLITEMVALVNFVLGETFELAFDEYDLNGQGWVFEHITRPAENGYTPVGHVFTATMSGKYGIAYKGPIIDIRQGDKGEILSIALARPERFLYELGTFDDDPPKKSWIERLLPGDAEEAEPHSGVRHHEKDYAGGVVALDARVINNIVVRSIADELLEQIDEEVPDEPEVPVA